MTEETRQDQGQEQSAGQAADPGAAVATEEAPKKLRQQVEIRDVGPCKKHIKVSVQREDIDARMGDHFTKLVRESSVTGFRPGKAPRKLIEKRFHNDVAGQVKAEVLLASLEQVGDDHDIAPLAPPQIDPDKIEIPREGPLVYEFEVEVRPQFDLPNYKGLKLKRPVKTYTADDVAEARRRFLTSYGQIVPKEGGAVELGDIAVCDVTVKDADKVVGTLKETNLRVERSLAFKDGIIRKFDEKMKGAKAGDTRALDVELASNAAGNMGGKTVQATFEVKDVKTIRLPELTAEYVKESFGLQNAEQLDEMIKGALERNLEHEQRRSARMQVLGQITAASTWELPQDLLERQYRRARARRIMEMRGDGLSDADIAKQLRMMEQDIHTSTALALKEHFVLQKIAEEEKIEVDDKDVEDEIERIADQSGESPRRVRARLEKEDMIEALMAEMVERKALDLILDGAQYEDVPVDPEEQAEAELATVDAQAVPGEMRDAAAEAEAAAAAAAAPQEGK
jgi:trigger factor